MKNREVEVEGEKLRGGYEREGKKTKRRRGGGGEEEWIRGERKKEKERRVESKEEK